MNASRVILAVLILMQAAVGGFGPSSRVICVGGDGHVEIERIHQRGRCESVPAASCCAGGQQHHQACEHPHSDNEQENRECDDINLVDLDLKRDTATTSHHIANAGFPSLHGVPAQTVHNRLNVGSMGVDPPPLIPIRRMLRATILII